jgi:hypothetical protein
MLLDHAMVCTHLMTMAVCGAVTYSRDIDIGTIRFWNTSNLHHIRGGIIYHRGTTHSLNDSTSNGLNSGNIMLALIITIASYHDTK